jgi:hypothetical protein
MISRCWGGGNVRVSFHVCMYVCMHACMHACMHVDTLFAVCQSVHFSAYLRASSLLLSGLTTGREGVFRPGPISPAPVMVIHSMKCRPKNIETPLIASGSAGVVYVLILSCKTTACSITNRCHCLWVPNDHESQSSQLHLFIWVEKNPHRSRAESRNVAEGIPGPLKGLT